jgi:hypothetical protein
MKSILGVPLAVAATLLVAGTGCNGSNPNQLNGGPTGSSGGGGSSGCPTTGSGPAATVGSTSAGTGSGSTSGSITPAQAESLAERVVNYSEALRTASFKLVGDGPNLQDIEDMAAAGTGAAGATLYAAKIDAMMSDPRFAQRMVEYWHNTMRMGGAASGMSPSFDTAPTFAARLTVEGQPYTNLFTATTNTCPTFDPSTSTFADGSCMNGPVTVGILSDAGVQAQYYSNLAMRRVRFFQEVFVCQAEPAEISAKPIPMGAGDYSSPWPFASIAGTENPNNGGRIDFHDTTSAICANCHSTSNHRAPLFANFDMNGQYQTTIQVHIPITGTPLAVPNDWLPTGEPTAWKYKVPTATLTEMGAAMAQDPDVQACAVARIWNYAMSKGDIVNDAAQVPVDVIQPYITSFSQSGFNLRATIRAIFVNADFVRY